jgi:hypothetical protein
LQVELKNPDAHFEELIKFFFMFHGTSIDFSPGGESMYCFYCFNNMHTNAPCSLLTSFFSSPDLFLCVCGQNLHDENVIRRRRIVRGMMPVLNMRVGSFVPMRNNFALRTRRKEGLQTLITAGKGEGLRSENCIQPTLDLPMNTILLMRNINNT